MIRAFLQYAREHRMYIHSESRKIGIKDIIIGWALIAIAGALFEETYLTLPLSLNYTIQFLSGTLLLFLASMFKGFSFIRVNEGQFQRSPKDHFNPRQRLFLLWIRGFIATSGFMMFILARNIIGSIDNASLFGADALIYLGLMSFVLKEKVSKQEFLGVLIASSGILFMFFADILSSEPFNVIIGLSCGLLSSLALAVVTLMTSSMIQHDPPLRISFYQCLSGLAVSIIFVLISLVFNLWGDWYTEVSYLGILDAIGSGCVFAIALIFFMDAFYYAEPLLISTLSYSLVPLTILFNYFLLKKLPSNTDIIVTLLIAIGCGKLIIYEYKKTRRTSRPRFIPNYNISQQEHFQNLKKDFLNGKIGKYEYMSAFHEYNKVFLEYTNVLKGTNLSKIVIDDQKILFITKDKELIFETDGSCRSAPLEMINFGEYEKDETEFVINFLRQNDTILDVGAHIGWYTINIGKTFPKANIYCFEPVSDTYVYLKRNIGYNNINNVKAYNFGLYNENKEMEFYYFRRGSALASPVDLLERNSNKIHGQVKTLDSLVENGVINRSIDFLKIDVEGCEFAVLRGGESVIRESKPMIMIELVELWARKFRYSVNDVRIFLETLGYRCFQISEKKLVEICEINTEDTNENYNFFFLSLPVHFERVSKYIPIVNKKFE